MTLSKERRDQVGQDIVRQLGGRRFMLMTGVKQFNLEGDGSISFDLGSNGSESNYVRVEYNYNKDLYNLVFIKRTRKKDKELSMPGFPIWDYKFNELKRYDSIYNDQLRELFEDFTGMYLTL